jgi:hypothetical protein
MSKEEKPAAAAPAQKGSKAPEKDPNAQQTRPEDEKPAALTDSELTAAPQHVKDAAAKMGGSVPLGAPNNGEVLGRTLAVDSAYPETAPVPAAGDYRAAPYGPGAQLPEREKWSDSRPTLADLSEPGVMLEARTLNPSSGGVYAGGERIGREAQDVSVDLVRGRSDAHLAQLLADPNVELRVKHKPKK